MPTRWFSLHAALPATPGGATVQRRLVLNGLRRFAIRRETSKQRHTRAWQNIIAGLAVALAGLAVCLGSIDLGFVEIPRSPFFGGVIVVVGGLVAAAGVVGTLKRRVRD